MQYASSIKGADPPAPGSAQQTSAAPAFAPSPVPKQINYASDGVTDGLLFTPGASGTGIVVDLGEPSGSRPVVDVAASRKIHLLRGVRTSPFILS